MVLTSYNDLLKCAVISENDINSYFEMVRL